MFRIEYRPISQQVYFGAMESDSLSAWLGLVGVAMATIVMGWFLYQQFQQPPQAGDDINNKTQSRSLPIEDLAKKEEEPMTEQSRLLPKTTAESATTEESLEDKLRASLTVGPKQDDMQALFDEIDDNGDGKLSMTEVEHAICHRKKKFNLKPAIVLRAFEKADSNKDGYVYREEFFMFLNMITYFNNLYQVFTLMDTNKDRHLSKEEFLNAADILNVPNPEAVFEQMDEHMLGYIVFDDFCLWMAEHQVKCNES